MKIEHLDKFNCFFLQAGLKVGDMILAINTETFLHISYDQVNITYTFKSEVFL